MPEGKLCLSFVVPTAGNGSEPALFKPSFSAELGSEQFKECMGFNGVWTVSVPHTKGQTRMVQTGKALLNSL